MDNSQLSDLKIGQITADRGTVFKDRELWRNILGVKDKEVVFLL